MKFISVISLLFLINTSFAQKAKISLATLYSGDPCNSCKPASFPGGDNNLQDYISNEFKRESITKVSVAILLKIDESGKIEKVKIQSTDDSLTNNTIITIIKNMPAWEPMDKDNIKMKSTVGMQIYYNSDANAPESVVKLQKGDKMPAVNLQDINGKSLDLKEKYVLLDFWATWCEPCIKGIPDLVNTYKKYDKKGLKFISIAFDREENKTKYKNIITKNSMVWSQVFLDSDKEESEHILKQLGITSVPVFILIDKKGTIVYYNSGINGLKEIKYKDKNNRQ
jgi:thiol-disulfide isomerase/thioredoxin